MPLPWEGGLRKGSLLGPALPHICHHSHLPALMPSHCQLLSRTPALLPHALSLPKKGACVTYMVETHTQSVCYRSTQWECTLGRLAAGAWEGQGTGGESANSRGVVVVRQGRRGSPSQAPGLAEGVFSPLQ